ncbi:hypothetical protein C8R30_10270 [Nitrosomonas nitrosa]|uniref:hypothetical protein n=1 Tax=Nitrosomonas nitrosa TaxID=52442 RepID=UPI000D3066BA|nr:hypothetical protein [Nitrosomonas nitrosa]PTR04710.1 hypothetical protein C8R30_10270 [Nitrosomonas nitrosa]
MHGVTAIQFTQDQTRILTGVSVETVRHWRKAIPYLSTKMGKSARFTFADLVGLAVTNELVSSFGVHIAALSVGVDALFRLLAASSTISLEGAIVFVTTTNATLSIAGTEDINQVLAKPALMIPLAPLIAKIKQHMFPSVSALSQAELPFPPEIVRSRA